MTVSKGEPLSDAASAGSAAVAAGGPKLGFAPKLFYGLGSIAYGVKDQGFQALLLIYYNQVLGLPAIMVSTALMLALVLDAFIDPIVGQVSDNWRSRLGRRHPFMYVAAIPICVAFYFIWNPPELAAGAMFFYLLAVAVTLRAFLSMYEIPNASLLPELTENYDERTALYSYRYFFGMAGGLGMTVAAFSIFLRPTAAFPTGQLNPDGYHAYSIAAIVVMLASILISALGTQKVAQRFRAPPVRRIGLTRTLREMFETISNKSILVMLGVGMFSGMATGMAGALNIYLTTYFWGLRGDQISLLSMAALFGSGIAVAVATPISKRIGKKYTCVGGFAIYLVISSTLILLRIFDVLAANGSNLLVGLLFGQAVLTIAAGVTSAIAAGSMIADVVEEVEEKTGRRSEGLLLSANTFVAKAVSGFGLLAAGLLLSFVKFPSGAQPSEVPLEVLHNLGVVYIAALLMLYSVAMVCLFNYPLSRQGHEARLQRLAARGARPAE
ncbi:MFS transporter [uncultured Phenylobacterium sp.]|uniref:MFS transporter n=1 Tax=uncultured Phenylobacterium sp. TaxID=349273 RepID=UPI0025E90929|nr:MFS transporter [uncultured Phenylobacterium sp.]